MSENLWGETLFDVEEDKFGELELVVDKDDLFESITYGCDLNFTDVNGDVWSSYLGPHGIKDLLEFLEGVYKRISIEE